MDDGENLVVLRPATATAAAASFHAGSGSIEGGETPRLYDSRGWLRARPEDFVEVRKVVGEEEPAGESAAAAAVAAAVSAVAVAAAAAAAIVPPPAPAALAAPAPAAAAPAPVTTPGAARPTPGVHATAIGPLLAALRAGSRS